MVYIAKNLSFDLGEPWRIVFSAMGQVCPGTPRCPHGIQPMLTARHSTRCPWSQSVRCIWSTLRSFQGWTTLPREGGVHWTAIGNSGGSIRNIYLHPCLGTCLYLWDLWEIIGMNTNWRFQRSGIEHEACGEWEYRGIYPTIAGNQLLDKWVQLRLEIWGYVY